MSTYKIEWDAKDVGFPQFPSKREPLLCGENKAARESAARYLSTSILSVWLRESISVYGLAEGWEPIYEMQDDEHSTSGMVAIHVKPVANGEGSASVGDWRWCALGEIGDAVSLEDAQRQVEHVQASGGPSTRRLDVMESGIRVGDLRKANGVYSFIANGDVESHYDCLQRAYSVKPYLFAPFRERVVSKSRADRKVWFEELGLAEDADDFDFLVATRAALVTDRLTVREASDVQS